MVRVWPAWMAEKGTRSSSEWQPAGRIHPSGGGDPEAADKAPYPVMDMEPVCRYFAMQRASKMEINVGLHGSHGLPSAVPGKRHPGKTREDRPSSIYISYEG